MTFVTPAPVRARGKLQQEPRILVGMRQEKLVCGKVPDITNCRLALRQFQWRLDPRLRGDDKEKRE